MKQFIDIHTHGKVIPENVLAVRNLAANELPLSKVTIKNKVSIGYHPWEIDTDLQAIEMFKTIETFLANPKVVLIGETGLDRIINVPLELQKELFALHVLASEKLQKPLIIHCVRAYQELMLIKKSIRPKMPWIIHGFQSNSQILEQLVNKGFYISFSPKILLDEEKFRKLLLLIPKSRLFFETDDMHTDIENLYRKAAFLLGVDLDELIMIIHGNAKTLLKI